MSLIYTFRPIERWPRSETPEYQRKEALFKSTYERTLSLLDDELEKVAKTGKDGCKRIVVQAWVSEADIRIDGLLRSNSRPAKPGVIVAFEHRQQGPVQMPCDRFRHWTDNLRAIALSLQALRQVDRYGITQHGEQYRGWKALPEASTATSIETAAKVIAQQSGFDEGAIRANAEYFAAAYRTAARTAHPDAGGSRENWDVLQSARQTLATHHGVR